MTALLDHPPARPPDLHLCLTKAEVAALCGVEASVVADWVRKGIIPGPIPGTRRWNRDHLREHLLNRSKGVQDGRPGGDDDWSV